MVAIAQLLSTHLWLLDFVTLCLFGTVMLKHGKFNSSFLTLLTTVAVSGTIIRYETMVRDFVSPASSEATLILWCFGFVLADAIVVFGLYKLHQIIKRRFNRAIGQLSLTIASLLTVGVIYAQFGPLLFDSPGPSYPFWILTAFYVGCILLDILAIFAISKIHQAAAIQPRLLARTYLLAFFAAGWLHLLRFNDRLFWPSVDFGQFYQLSLTSINIGTSIVAPVTCHTGRHEPDEQTPTKKRPVESLMDNTLTTLIAVSLQLPLTALLLRQFWLAAGPWPIALPGPGMSKPAPSSQSETLLLPLDDIDFADEQGPDSPIYQWAAGFIAHRRHETLPLKTLPQLLDALVLYQRLFCYLYASAGRSPFDSSRRYVNVEALNALLQLSKHLQNTLRSKWHSPVAVEANSDGCLALPEKWQDYFLRLNPGDEVGRMFRWAALHFTGQSIIKSDIEDTRDLMQVLTAIHQGLSCHQPSTALGSQQQTVTIADAELCGLLQLVTQVEITTLDNWQFGNSSHGVFQQ